MENLTHMNVQSYVESKWSDMEFMAAHKKALQDKIQVWERREVSVMLLDQVKPSLFSKHLSVILSCTTWIKLISTWCLCQPNPDYASISQLFSAFSSLFQPIQAYAIIFKPVLAYSNLFTSYYNLCQPF